MKKDIHLAFLILAFFGLQKLNAQTIPNGSFEQWSAGVPVDWYGDSTFLIQSINAWAGQYAAELTLKDEGGTYVTTPLTTGSGNGPNYATTGRPDTLYFWYIFNTVNGTSFEIQTAGFNDSSGLSAQGNPFTVDSSNSVYKLGAIGYQYGKPSGELDTMSITIAIIIPNPTGNNAGSYLIVDDFSFGSTTAVSDLLGNGIITIEKIQPNPANDKTEIVYNLPVTANVTLDLFDLEGRKVQTVVNARQTSGTYKAIVNTANLPAGNYYCRLNADGAITTGKMIVVK